MTVKTIALKCPTCGKQVLMTDAYPERPFCSKRCKDIDFGDWASESYQIEGGDEENELWSEDSEY